MRYHLLETNLPPDAMWTRACLAGAPHHCVELGHRIVLQVAPGTDLHPLLSAHGLTVARTIRTNLFILQAADSPSAIRAAEALADASGVTACYPVMRRPLCRHDAFAPAPNDAYFGEQWHLEDRGTNGNILGADLNVRAAWPWANGAGVQVAVADVGFQLDHPDLARAAAGGWHWNFFLGTSNGSPYAADADHATCVAGLIAAESGNERGVAGVAPEARLSSWVIWGVSPTSGSEVFVTDEQLMDMFEHAMDRVAVQNHSWGNSGTSQLGLDALSDAGISNAVTLGRGGKGVVMVRAGGNERQSSVNVNDDGYANDPRGIAVAAVRRDGRACSFSTPGACLLVSAPSGDYLDVNSDGVPDREDPASPGVLTTDRTGDSGYTAGTDDRAGYAGFFGTSAASPEVAGVVALLLSVNTNLTYLDVQHLLVQSARHYDFADPDLRTNGAGLRFSHNQGFGVPDAGFAVQLARGWSNRPARQRVTLQSTAAQAIPDDALRVLCAGAGLSNALSSIRCLPSMGPHPDAPTATLPLVYVGQANEELAVDLHGKAALIQRGTSLFYEKIQRAARAGAAFAIIFNNTGTIAIQRMGMTDYVPIPAVSIGQSDGEALRDFIATHPATTARLQLTPAVYTLALTNTLTCEHVGVRLQTTHTNRSDVRITLVSPMGTRSVLQALNEDSSAGPEDWTYWSTQHFYESSAGTWRLEVSDEMATTINNVPATGSVTFAELIVDGVPITDTDRDGLDDGWERHWLGGLGYGPKDDPDGDGFNNAREQVVGTDPLKPNAALNLDFTQWKPGYWRLSWPANAGVNYSVLSGGGMGGQSWTPLMTVTGSWPVAEAVIPATNSARFFRVRE